MRSMSISKGKLFKDDEVIEKLEQIPIYKDNSSQSIFDRVPATNSKKALETWKRLGPINVVDVYKSVLYHYPDVEEEFSQKVQKDEIEFMADRKDEWGFSNTGT